MLGTKESVRLMLLDVFEEHEEYKVKGVADD